MKKKENSTSTSMVEPVNDDSWVPGEDRKAKREFLDKKVAKSLESSIRQLTDIPFNFREVEVLNASMKGGRLVLTVETPLWLPEPVGDSGEYLGTRKQSAEFCRAFEKHLKRNLSATNRQKLSNILHSEFDSFVRTIICIRNANVMEHVPKTTERRGAGHPRMNLDRETVASLVARSKAIRPSLREVRNEIGGWKAANPGLEDDERCREHIRKAFSDRFDWIPIFLEIKWGNKCTSRKVERTVRISDLPSWSATNRADLIALEEHRLRTQQSVSLSKFQQRKLELRASRRASPQRIV